MNTMTAASRKIRVLIVDDQSRMRSLLRLLLQDDPDLGVEETASGREAIQRSIEFHPHVVLMDIAMPEMNGVEATAAIKRLLPSTQVIALTIHDNLEFRYAMSRAGACRYVLKQELSGELINLIHKVAESV